MRALLSLAVFSAGCGFSEGVPDGALLFCASDEDCPTGLDCNVGTHLCAADLTAPTIVAAVLVSPPANDTFADVAGFDEVSVALTSSEPIPVGGARVALGGLESDACDGTGAERTCRIAIPAGFDGAEVTSLAISIVDVAGNAANSAVPLAVDTAPPEVVAEATELVIDTAGSITAVATTSSFVTVTFVTSEDVAALPAVFLDVSGVRMPFERVAGAGRRFTFRYDDARVVAPGSYPVLADLVDRFGHAAEVTLTTLTIVGAGELCPAPPGVTCADFDGDGAFAVTSCPLGTDHDDRDATVYPGAVEIPGDGRDNDGLLGDVARDEAAGAFVSCAAPAGGDGSRAAPFRTMQEAEDAGAPFVFLATCADPYDSPITFSPVVGGLDPSTWEQVGRSAVRGSGLRTTALMDGIVSTDALALEGPLLVRSAFARVDTEGGDRRVVASEIGVLTADTEAILVVIDSQLDRLVMARASATLSRCRVTQGVALEHQFASLVATSSVLSTTAGSVISVTEGFSISLFHTTVLELDVAAFAAIKGGLLANLKIVASSIVSANASPVVQVSRDVLTILSSNISGPGGALRIAFADVSGSIDDCESGGCVLSDGNTALTLSTSGDYRLSASSPLRDRGAFAIDLGAPTSVVGDIDGDCRYEDGLADVGADELR